MSRNKKQLTSLRVRQPKTVDDFIHGDDAENSATPKVPESGVNYTPPPTIAIVDAAPDRERVPGRTEKAMAKEEIGVSVQNYEATCVLYQRTDGQTKRKRVAYLPLALDRDVRLLGADLRRSAAKSCTNAPQP